MEDEKRPEWVSWREKQKDDYQYKDHHYGCSCDEPACLCLTEFLLATIVWQLDQRPPNA